ncbi:MAG TPA: PAS domain-containing protein [Dehalococcoidia bacterium]|nr:PAS domain-containing protein [Dehalococcoidia bacterium]
MPQLDVELILTRQWASYLAIPIWLMGSEGNLLYYNEPAERLLGLRFDEAGPILLSEISDVFLVTDPDGSAVAPEEIPLGKALQDQRPAHRALRWRGLDGIWHTGEVTALPLQGQDGRALGVVAMFWENAE